MEHFMTLDDRTVISYAKTKKEGELRVIIEKPDPTDFSHSVTCLLPDYRWMNNHGFTERELEKYRKVLEQYADSLMREAGIEIKLAYDEKKDYSVL